jgi:lauroyl/myristoyl acyltransferase
VSDAILSQPEQWFWYNKRWVLEPVEEDGKSE